jgi:hypothetical protein
MPMLMPWSVPNSWLILTLLGTIQQTQEKLDRAMKRYEGKKSETINDQN